MTANKNTNPHIEVIESLRDDFVRGQIIAIDRRTSLVDAVRFGIKNGISVDNLAESSGLPVEEITRIAEREAGLAFA